MTVKAGSKKGKKSAASDLAALKARVASTVHATLGYAAVASGLEDRMAHPRWCVSTRLRLLDIALGGGLYEGHMARFYGMFGAGKTGLLQHLMLCMMAEEGVCSYQDLEHAFVPSRLAKLAAGPRLEVREDLILPGEPKTLEDMFRTMHVTMHQVNPVPESYSERPECKYKLGFFVDTTSDAPMSAEREATLEGSGKRKKKPTSFREGMDRAKFIRAEMRKLSTPIALHGATMVILEQGMAKIGGYGAQTTVGGGAGVSFKASQSALVSNSSAFQDSKTGVEAGFIVRIKVDKGRFTKSRSVVEIPYYYDRGFNDLESIVLLLEKHGVLEAKGKTEAYEIPGPDSTPITFTRREIETFSADPTVEAALHTLADKYQELLWVKKTTKAGVKSLLDDIDADGSDDDAEEDTDE